jgi:cyclohexadienyl dehydratase
MPSTAARPAVVGRSKRRPRSARAAVALLALTLAFWVAPSRPGAAEAEPARTLKVGTSGDYPPFSRLDPASGEYGGFDVDVVRALAESRGWKVEFVPFRWPMLLDDLVAGRFELATSGITARPDRSIAARSSIAVAETGALVLLHSAEARGRSVAELDLPTLTLAVNAGGHLERVARSRFHHARIVALPNNAAVEMSLLDRSVDGVVTDTLEAERWDAAHRLTRIGPLTRDRKVYLMDRDDEELARIVDGFLLAAEADGTLADLRRRWFGESSTAATARPLEALVAAIDERLGLMREVARAKAAAGLAIEDTEREGRVLAAALSDWHRASGGEAEAPSGQDRAVTEFFAVLIEAAKEIQRRTPAPGPEARPPDLQGELRPALLAIGRRIALAGAALDHRLSERLTLAMLHRELAHHQLPDELLARMAAAVAQLAGRS